MRVQEKIWLIIFVLLLFLPILRVVAQQEQKVVSLGDAISLAREQSLDAMVAGNGA